MSFVKTGDGKIISVIEQDELDEKSKRALVDVTEQALKEAKKQEKNNPPKVES